MLPACPHCGSVSDGVYANDRWFGWGETHYDANGVILEKETDRLRTIPSATLRCSACLKIRRDVMRVGLRVLARPSRRRE